KMMQTKFVRIPQVDLGSVDPAQCVGDLVGVTQGEDGLVTIEGQSWILIPYKLWWAPRIIIKIKITIEGSDKETVLLPMLNSSNYSGWNLRLLFHLWSTDLLDLCEAPFSDGATVPATNKWIKASHQSIIIIASRLSHVVFLGVINNETKENSHLL
ncbi:hypothetical protein O181_080242, partial [Austropuccinia psidii MF-1]|nr:hypothetical protein [Austropuccinia psidii MF-1]